MRLYSFNPGPTSVRGGSTYNSYLVKLLNMQMKSHTLSEDMCAYHRIKIFIHLNSKDL